MHEPRKSPSFHCLQTSHRLSTSWGALSVLTDRTGLSCLASHASGQVMHPANTHSTAADEWTASSAVPRGATMSPRASGKEDN